MQACTLRQMTIDACAALVARGDPDRFMAAMAAPVAARARLFPLYAFNLEVARAPWVTAEPLIAEMRLQWWRDVVAAPTARAHEVAGPLHALIAEAGLPVAVLDRLIAARRWDVAREPFADAAEFDRYIDDTAGGLMWLAARACGGLEGAETVARNLGWAAGLAAYLRAVPDLAARGRVPLVDDAPGALVALASKGLSRLDDARLALHRLGPGRVAALAAWQAGPILRLVLQRPARVAEGRLQRSEFARRAGLMLAALTGRV